MSQDDLATRVSALCSRSEDDLWLVNDGVYFNLQVGATDDRQWVDLSFPLQYLTEDNAIELMSVALTMNASHFLMSDIATWFGLSGDDQPCIVLYQRFFDAFVTESDVLNHIQQVADQMHLLKRDLMAAA